MKCPACGYTREVETVFYEEPRRFKSGKRKGEYKGSVLKELKLEVGTCDFVRIDLTPQLQESCQVLICPECKTMTYDEFLPMEN